MDKRWCIYIDIEGFGALYKDSNAALLSLCDLMEGIYLIGTNCYPETPDRLFAHQTGDGFFIVSEFGMESLEIPVAIAIALMRHVTKSGCFAKASIAEGDNADITGCYPECIREARLENGYVSLGGGLMKLWTVMGTALINAVVLNKKTPSGALLTLSAENPKRIPDDCGVKTIPSSDLKSIDWVNCAPSLVSDIQKEAELYSPDAPKLKAKFENYFRESGAPKKWKENTNRFQSLCL